MKEQDRYVFPAVLTYEDGQEIAVVFPDLDVATSGTDERDALLSARELLGVALCGMEEDGEEIPAPSALSSIAIAKNERVILGQPDPDDILTEEDIADIQEAREEYQNGESVAWEDINWK